MARRWFAGRCCTTRGHPAQDRPAHVRASLDGVLVRRAAKQDDAHSWRWSIGAAAAWAVAAGEGGERLFDERRGNKGRKLDLEAGFVLARPDGERLIGLGSGSSPRRERILVVRRAAGSFDVRSVDAHALYASLRELTDFAGSELNVEGACVAAGGAVVRLFNRGNGAPADGRLPVDATCELDAGELLRWLEGERGEPPRPRDVVAYDLGVVDGVRLTFTDAEAFRDGVLYVAAAEDSPDAVRDGPVAGVVLGMIEPAGARWTRVLDERGKPLAEKIEGVVGDRDDTRRVFAVVMRTIDLPASLLELALEGGGRLPRCGLKPARTRAQRRRERREGARVRVAAAVDDEERRRRVVGDAEGLHRGGVPDVAAGGGRPARPTCRPAACPARW